MAWAERAGNNYIIHQENILEAKNLTVHLNSGPLKLSMNTQNMILNHLPYENLSHSGSLRLSNFPKLRLISNGLVTKTLLEALSLHFRF